jgi:uncharacterized SAM-binding protein YcdF (DUF218 family)
LWIIAVVLLNFADLSGRLFVWPDLPRVPAHVDAIVELGGPGELGRDEVAERLAREGRASFLVQSTVAAEAGTHRCLVAPTGVTVLCFSADPATTRGEAEAIARLARKHDWRSVVLITTPDQAWRAYLRVRRCFDGQVYVATAHLPLHEWFRQIPYQWAAMVKAEFLQRAC